MSHLRSSIAVAFALLTLISCTEVENSKLNEYTQKSYDSMKQKCFDRGGYLFIESFRDGCIFKNPEAK